MSSITDTNDKTPEIVREAVRGYIVTLNGRGDTISDSDDIISKGVIASMQLLDLINFVADSYDVEIDESHVFDGHFASIKTIVDFVCEAR